MGMGKTEAALGAAYQLISNGHATGLYFALPTQATSNRIHQRVSEFLNRCGGNTSRLILSGSWLIDDKITFPHQEGFGSDFRSARDWFASSKRALLAPFGVGTIDQALMAVIAVRHFFIRYFALAGKVVVIDEVHSYDVYSGTLVTALVDALRQLGCTVIILSATLTRERRLQLLASSTDNQTELANSDAFPLITGNTSAGAIRSCPIDPPPAKPPIAIRFRSESETRIAAVNAAEAGACVLWICNTVDRAIATREALASGLRADRATVGLLHSSFPFFEREAHETHWLDSLGKDRTHRPKGCLLISTQIVEQSVDIDADLIISEMAPTDMLFQRLGRMWRHWINGEARPGFPQPEFWILEETTPWDQIKSQLDSREIRRALGKKAWVYQPYVLLRSLEVWHASSQVTLPTDIRPWLEETYVSRVEVECPAWQELHSIMIRQKEKHLGQATTAQNVWSLNTLKDEEGVGTRLNQSPALPLILAKKQTRETLELLDGSAVVLDSDFHYATAKALHRNIVKAPLHWFANNGGRLRSVSSAAGFILRLHVKGDFEIGFVRDGVVDIDSLPEGTQLRYDSCRGLRREEHRNQNSDPSFESDDFDPCDW